MTYNNYMRFSKGQVAHQPKTAVTPKGNEEMIEALHYKLENVTKAFCSITKTLHDCESVYIYPPYEYRTKGGYKKPMPRLKKNKIKTVESFLASKPTIQQLEELHYQVVASEGFYFRDTTVKISQLIK